jgi:hypothetical protein
MHWKLNILVTEILDLRSFQILGIYSRSISRANCMDCMIEFGNYYLPVFPGLFVCLCPSSLQLSVLNRMEQGLSNLMFWFIWLYTGCYHSRAWKYCNKWMQLKERPKGMCQSCVIHCSMQIYSRATCVTHWWAHSDPLVFTPVKNMLCLTHQCYPHLDANVFVDRLLIWNMAWKLDKKWYVLWLIQVWMNCRPGVSDHPVQVLCLVQVHIIYQEFHDFWCESV